MSETIQESYAALVLALRELGDALIPATAAQYEAPPRARSSERGGAHGVNNPTLDIVLDPRRLALSEEIGRTSATLRQAARLVGQHTSSLRARTARWEGQDQGDELL